MSPHPRPTAGNHAARAATSPPAARILTEAEQPAAVRQVMTVQVATEEAGIRIFRGRLRESAAQAYTDLKLALAPQTVPMVQEDAQMGAAVVLIPHELEHATAHPSRLWLHWLLFIATILTTTWAGAQYAGVDILREPARFAVGLPYALGLLTILGVHEMGHYLTARHHQMDVTLPYFIPVPFALGTFGAFIQMRSPAEDRSALFDVAVAGPLAGLVIAIPAVVLGLHSSAIVAAPSSAAAGAGIGGLGLGSSVLFALLARLSLGHALPPHTTLALGPLAFAGWLGLYITALNLFPVGQLDGGHTAYAMFGRRAGKAISLIAMWSLLAVSLLFVPNLLFWAFIVFFLGTRHAPPLNDLTPITPGRMILGWVTFAILVLIVAPAPSWLL